MKMELTVCYETSACKIQTPGNYPEENIQHTEHGESLKSELLLAVSVNCFERIIDGSFDPALVTA